MQILKKIWNFLRSPYSVFIGFTILVIGLFLKNWSLTYLGAALMVIDVIGYTLYVKEEREHAGISNNPHKPS